MMCQWVWVRLGWIRLNRIHHMARDTYRTASALELDTRLDAHSVLKWAVRISAASVGW